VANLITLQQAKDHLKVVYADDDAQIQGMIAAALGALEGLTGRAIAPRAVAEVIDYFHDGMALSTVPYQSGIALSYVDAAGTTQVVPNFYFDNRRQPAKLYSIQGAGWPSMPAGRGKATLNYMAGYAAGEVPAPLVQWMLLALGTMYEHRASVVAGVSIAELPEGFMKCLYQQYTVYL